MTWALGSKPHQPIFASSDHRYRMQQFSSEGMYSCPGDLMAMAAEVKEMHCSEAIGRKQAYSGRGKKAAWCQQSNVK